jgi:hypothetical protein
VCVRFCRFSQAQADHEALCERLELEHEEAVSAAKREYEELRAFLGAHNEGLLGGRATGQGECVCVLVSACVSLGGCEGGRTGCIYTCRNASRRCSKQLQYPGTRGTQVHLDACTQSTRGTQVYQLQYPGTSTHTQTLGAPSL